MFKEKVLVQGESEVEELRSMGFKVIKCSQWHVRVFMEGCTTVVDIWPSMGKIMSLKGGIPTRYFNMVEAVKTLFMNGD